LALSEENMNYETLISWFAIILSIITFCRTVFCENRNRRIHLCERKQRITEEVLGLELVLSESFSNVLTTDQAKYRSEVQEVLKEMRDHLPKLLDALVAHRKTIEAIDYTDEKRLEQIRSDFSQLRMQSLSLNAKLQHGIKRGQDKQ